MAKVLRRKKSFTGIVESGTSSQANRGGDLERILSQPSDGRIVGAVSKHPFKEGFCYLWNGHQWHFLFEKHYRDNLSFLDDGDLVEFTSIEDARGPYPLAINATYYNGPPVSISPPNIRGLRKYDDNLGVYNPQEPFYRGTVAFFNEEKGFGFIEPVGQARAATSNRDVMAPFRAIDMEGFKTLEPGQRVEFQFIEREKGPYATYIRVIGK